MEPLYDQSGEVYSWITRQTGRIVDLLGRHVAFVEGENVYNWGGQHIGWWQKRHIRNHDGDVALFLHRARDFWAYQAGSRNGTSAAYRSTDPYAASARAAATQSRLPVGVGAINAILEAKRDSTDLRETGVSNMTDPHLKVVATPRPTPLHPKQFFLIVATMTKAFSASKAR